MSSERSVDGCPKLKGIGLMGGVGSGRIGL